MLLLLALRRWCHRDHDLPELGRVFLSGQKCGVVGVIKREFWHRNTIEAVIGRMKTDGRLARNDLKAFNGDHANDVFAAVG